MSLEPRFDPNEGGDREDLRRLLRRWLELKEMELELLKRLEVLLAGEAAGDPALRIVGVEQEDGPSSPAPGGDPLQKEILGVLEQTLPPGEVDLSDPGEAAAVADLRVLLIHLVGDRGGAWKAVPWEDVASVRLPDEVTDGGSEENDGYEIVWTGGRGILGVSRVGQLLSLDAAASMGVEEALTAPEQPGAPVVPVALIDLAARPRFRPEQPAPAAAGRKAMVAVRYLPARVALVRILRAAGWEVVEEPDPAAGALGFRTGGLTLVLIEAQESAASRLPEIAREARMAGVHVVEVASRYRAEAPQAGTQGHLPRLLHPFAEGEVEALLERVSRL